MNAGRDTLSTVSLYERCCAALRMTTWGVMAQVQIITPSVLRTGDFGSNMKPSTRRPASSWLSLMKFPFFTRNRSQRVRAGGRTGGTPRGATSVAGKPGGVRSRVSFTVSMQQTALRRGRRISRRPARVLHARLAGRSAHDRGRRSDPHSESC